MTFEHCVTKMLCLLDVPISLEILYAIVLRENFLCSVPPLEQILVASPPTRIRRERCVHAGKRSVQF